MPSAGVPIVAPPGGQVSQREFIYGRLTSEQRSVGLIIHHLHPVGRQCGGAVITPWTPDRAATKIRRLKDLPTGSGELANPG